MTKRNEPFVGVSFCAVRAVPRGDLVIRFVFGAGISVIAAIISYVFGARFGGIFLAFPAILPATLTLIEKEESKRKAEDDDIGAILGAAALIVFGGLVWWLIPIIGAPGAIAVAVFGWLSAAVLFYAVLRVVSSRRSPQVES